MSLLNEQQNLSEEFVYERMAGQAERKWVVYVYWKHLVIAVLSSQAAIK